ncbi:MAG: hypothetical protein B6I22_08445 [Desulfobacteraceae bacterium 4572_123]|nr:MAG: hypothetical protein B6I22_08445 [Desulfobacteraceae bacterium 4572_123]
MTIFAILRDCRLQRLKVNLEIIIDRHEMERIATQAQHFLEPADHLLLDGVGAVMVKVAGVGVHRSCQ